MGKTYRNMPTKNRNSHEDARPYTRTRENLHRNIDYHEPKLVEPIELMWNDEQGELEMK